MGNKKFAEKDFNGKRKEANSKIKYYEDKLQYWLKISRKLSSGTWTKADDDLIDLQLEKDNG